MNVSIETITFVTAPGIASVDVRKLSATELSTAVRSIEDEIKSLEAIEAKPLSVIERISDLRKGLSDLVKAADDAHRAKQSK